MTRYDVAVVGAGPAGLAAALNAAVRRKSVIVFGPKMSEKLQKSEYIDNVLGLPGENGPSLLGKFRHHVEQQEQVTFLEENVQVIYDMGKAIGLLLSGNRIIEARSVVLATGVSFGTPIPGEMEHLGRGVGYCATCDAALYKGRPVIVVGYNDHAVEEANFIAEMASSTVFVNCTGRDVTLADNVTEVRGKPLEILVKPKEAADSPEATTGQSSGMQLRLDGQTLEADGIFLIRDARAADKLVPGLALDGAHVIVDSKMQTNLSGMFAAGDLTGQPYQINVAVGRGQIAGLEAAKFATMQAAAEKAAAKAAGKPSAE